MEGGGGRYLLLGEVPTGTNMSTNYFSQSGLF